MPYVIVKEHGQECIHVQNADGSTGDAVPGGCHDTHQQAVEHMRALYVNVPEARTAATATAAPCSCGGHAATVTDDLVRVAALTTAPLDTPYPVPAYPPRAWFYEKPDWFKTPDDTMRAHLAAGGLPQDAPIQKLQVDGQGRAAGYFQQFGQCLIHNHAGCPGPSPTGHSGFHQSHLVAEDGEIVTVGILANVGGHASPYAPISVAHEHYANPDTAIVGCRAYDDEVGSYLLGAVVPWATYGDVARARLHPLSGDWREMAQSWWDAHGIQASVVQACEGYDCIGPTFVNRGGLPLPRNAIRAGVEDNMAESPVVVHQHFHDAPPGPRPAMQAADVPAAPPNGEPPDDAKQETEVGARVDALEQAMSDVMDRLAQCEQAIGQMADAQMAALEAEAVTLPERSTR